MWSFPALCDEFCVTCRLFFKLDLDPSRETLLHFLERIRRSYPDMTRLRRRDDDALMLDEEGKDGRRRYLRLDPNALRFGSYAASDIDEVAKFGEIVLSQAPAHLSLSDLDFDYIEVVFSLDLEYRGNHDELVADTLFSDHPVLGALSANGERIIDCQPFFGATLSDDCERQVYLEVKGRTSTFEIRANDFEPQPLSVLTTVRQYWSFGEQMDLASVHRALLSAAEKYASNIAVPLLVQPLRNAIASRR